MKLVNLIFKPVDTYISRGKKIGMYYWIAHHDSAYYYYEKPGEIKVVRYVEVKPLPKETNAAIGRCIKHTLKLSPAMTTYTLLKYPL